MNAREIKIFIISAIIMASFACLPLMDDGYWLALGVNIAMYAVLATSWALFSGPTNYISLATAAFFGLGMYVVGLGLEYELAAIPVLTVVAGVAGAVLAGVVGIATLRLSGVYFVIFTLGLAELIRQLVTWAQTNFGDLPGMYVFTDLTEKHIFWELVVLLAIVFVMGWLIQRSRLGFSMRIIGNDETVATHCGINTARAKVILFMVSGAVAAIAGAIMAPRWTYIEPNSAFGAMISFQVVIMALLGGVHRLWGPLLGVIPFTILWELISVNFPNQTTLLLGVAFMLIVYFIPHGVVGRAEELIAKFGKGKGGSHE